MVIAKILSVMCISPEPSALALGNRVLGLHIDYANREESGEEADFVEQWCISNGIEFHKRTINEVTRGTHPVALK